MNKMILFLSFVLIASAAVAADADADRLAAIVTELRQVMSESRASKTTLSLKRAADEAQLALEQAEQTTAGIAEIDVRIAELREQMGKLYSERRAKLKANSSVLDARRVALEEAQAAYALARRGGPRGEALLRERNSLLRELPPEEAAAALDSVERGVVKP